MTSNRCTHVHILSIGKRIKETALGVLMHICDPSNQHGIRLGPVGTRLACGSGARGRKKEEEREEDSQSKESSEITNKSFRIFKVCAPSSPKQE